MTIIGKRAGGVGSRLFFRMLDALAGNSGRLLSIRALTKEMSSKNKPEFYANVYHKVKELERKGVLKIIRAGRSSLVELDFSSGESRQALTELELAKTGELFEDPRTASMRRGLDALFYGAPFLGAACVIRDAKLLALNRMELLFLLRPPSGKHGVQETVENDRAVLAERVKTLASNANTAVDFLALTADEFADAVFSGEANPVKELAKKEVAVFNPGFYWMVIAAGKQKGMKLDLQEAADPRALSRADIMQAFGRHGYREMGAPSASRSNYSVETAIAAALVLEDARLLEAIPVVLAKDKRQEINYALIEYLANKHGKLDLLGFLLETTVGLSPALKENVKARECLERINKAVKTVAWRGRWRTKLLLRREDIRDKLRLYHAD